MSPRILAIDAGNTRIKLALIEGGEIHHLVGMDSDAFNLTLLTHELVQIEKPDGVILASVVRGVGDIVSRAVEAAFELDLVIAQPDGVGIDVAVPNPGGVGIDRLIMSGEAYRHTNTTTFVVGVGTAITIDLVSSEGVYLGGTISPGLKTSAWALAERASLLPEVSLDQPIGEGVPNNTESGIRNGLLLGAAGAVDRLIVDLAQKAMVDVFRVILTGGDCRYLASLIASPHLVVDDLVLKGLARIYQLEIGERRR